MNCIKCSKDLADGAKFCKFCGEAQSVTNEKEPSVEETKTIETEVSTETTAPVEDTTPVEKSTEPAKIINTDALKQQTAEVAQTIKKQTAEVAEKIKSVDTDALKQQATEVAEKIKSVDVESIKKSADELVNTTKNFKDSSPKSKKRVIVAGVASAAIIAGMCLIGSSLFGSNDTGVLYMTDDNEYMFKSDYKTKTSSVELFELSNGDKRYEYLTDSNILYTFISESKNTGYTSTLYYYDLSAKNVKEIEIDSFKSSYGYIEIYGASGDNFHFLLEDELYYYDAKSKKAVEVMDSVTSILVDGDNKASFVTSYISKDNTYELYKISSNTKAELIGEDFTRILTEEYANDIKNSSDVKIYGQKYGEMHSYNVKNGKTELLYEIESDIKPSHSFNYENVTAPNVAYNKRSVVVSSAFYYETYNINLPLSSFINVDVDISSGIEPVAPDISNFKTTQTTTSFGNTYTNEVTDYNAYWEAMDVYNAANSAYKSTQVFAEALENLNAEQYTRKVTYYNLYQDGKLIAENISEIDSIDYNSLYLVYSPAANVIKYDFSEIIYGSYTSYTRVLSTLQDYVSRNGAFEIGENEIILVGKDLKQTDFTTMMEAMDIDDDVRIVDDAYFSEDGNIYVTVRDKDEYMYEVFKLEISKNELKAPVLIYSEDNYNSNIYLSEIKYNPYKKESYFVMYEDRIRTLYSLSNNTLTSICDDFYNIRFYENGDIYVTTDADSSGYGTTFRLHKLVSGKCESIVKNISSYTLLTDGSILYLEGLEYSNSGSVQGAELNKITKGNEDQIADEVISYRAIDANNKYE